MSAPRTILLAGASGYIGRALIPELRARFPAARIVALSRSPRTSEDPQVEWRTCDLFSLKELEEALPADLGFENGPRILERLRRRRERG